MPKPTKKPRPKTAGGQTIKHVQASSTHVRKVEITLPRISMEKSSA